MTNITFAVWVDVLQVALAVEEVFAVSVVEPRSSLRKGKEEKEEGGKGTKGEGGFGWRVAV